MIVAGCTRTSTADRPAPPAADGAPPAAAVDDAGGASTRDASLTALHGEVLACALTHPQTALYVHPEHPGRVPVSVHVDASIAVGVPPQAYDHAVLWSGPADALVDVTRVELRGDRATVELAIEEEGVRGTVDCVRGDDGGWAPGPAALAEH